MAAITQDYNSAITAPAAPSKTGYQFSGWNPSIPATMPAENVIITGEWTANTYSIHFNS
ncbi:InlB B-repeat-containing protein [bacterium]|nr:InlB B-repeat-containing protein [bacterium]